MKNFLSSIKYYLLAVLIFLFPLFFLSTTQEFFSTNKLYLLSFGALLLILVSVIEFALDKKIRFIKHHFGVVPILFLLTLVLSVLISSPNKIQTVFNPNFGLLMIFSLTVLYYYLANENKSLAKFFSVSSLILAVATIVFFFTPFKNVNLPVTWQFLKDPNFSPMGNKLDLAILLGFFATLNLVYTYQAFKDKKQTVKPLVYFLINFLALSFTLYSIFKPSGNQQSLLLPSVRLSWYAAVETLKNPLTALFGVGVDNFSSLFTRVKDFEYFQSTMWAINSFSISRSTLLHILTEVGLLGFLTFGYLIFLALKNLFGTKDKAGLQLEVVTMVLYSLAILVLFPPTLTILFLFFYSLSFIKPKKTEIKSDSPISLNLENSLPIYLTILVLTIMFIIASGYFLGRNYVAEYYFKKSFDEIAQKNPNVQQIYENQRRAALLNPNLEKFRITFAQTNLLIANNIASKGSAQQDKGNDKNQNKLTDQERQTIAQAIQAAIAEAKAAVQLNPQRASNWDNLATVYRNIINVAQDAQTWTISSYQRAIALDPQNPIYKLNLGGVYYQLGSFDDAVKLFEQSAAIKPNWSNAHYNLAWASYQKKDYQRAASEMEQALSLLDAKRDDADYKKAKNELEEFKKKIPAEQEKAATESATSNKTQNLILPTPAPSIEPKINLPKQSSPQ